MICNNSVILFILVSIVAIYFFWLGFLVGKKQGGNQK